VGDAAAQDAAPGGDLARGGAAGGAQDREGVLGVGREGRRGLRRGDLGEARDDLDRLVTLLLDGGETAGDLAQLDVGRQVIHPNEPDVLLQDVSLLLDGGSPRFSLGRARLRLLDPRLHRGEVGAVSTPEPLPGEERLGELVAVGAGGGLGTQRRVATGGAVDHAAVGPGARGGEALLHQILGERLGGEEGDGRALGAAPHPEGALAHRRVSGHLGEEAGAESHEGRDAGGHSIPRSQSRALAMRAR
jgi:hypothetical protein